MDLPGEQDVRPLAAGASAPITVNIVLSGAISSDFALTSATRARSQAKERNAACGPPLHNDRASSILEWVIGVGKRLCVAFVHRTLLGVCQGDFSG